MKQVAMRGKNGAGKFVLVDDEDFDRVKERRWYGYVARKGKNLYARTFIRESANNWRPVSLHKFILGESVTMADHKNSDGLDNRRDNLRPCNYSKNAMNARLRSDNTSGYKGVHWHKYKNKWRSTIRIDGDTKHLGYFINIAEAAEAYKKAARIYLGEFARIS